MPSAAPSANEPLAWNELIFTCVHEGQTTVWKGGKREISAFNDPAMWTSPETWSRYLTPLPDRAWGPDGYGLILVNMDTKTSWSVNDYSRPDSLFLPMDSLVDAQGGISIGSGFRELLAAPEAWHRVLLTLVPQPSALGRVQQALTVGGSPSLANSRVEMLLSDILSVDQAPDERLKALSLVRGTLSVSGQDFLFLGATFSPEGWTNHNDGGREPEDLWEELLTQAADTGMPPPDISSIEGLIEGWSQDHCPQEELDSLPDDEREELADEGPALSSKQLEQKFRNILNRWNEPKKDRFKP